MPVFNLELKFDDKGALQAVNQIDKVTGAADGATRAIDNLGNSSSRNGQALSQMGDKGSRAADAISSAMKRAAGQVLALVGAFTAVNKAMSFMNRGLELNSSLEQSKIGIASLINSMVKLQDSQGRLIEGQEKYNASQEMAASLMKEIQRLGLETTADAQSLVEGVQSIMGPALQAGIALEKIPQFAVAGAQAMQTLGIPLNQMRTELDALLTGSVNLSQDILAPKLFQDVQGNIKDYIQGLKTAGKLEEELMRRLQPFIDAGKDVAQTWQGLTSNLDEAFDKLASDSALGFTKAMKQSVSELQDLLVKTEGGTTKISSDFQEIASLLTDIQDWIGNKILSSTQTLISYTKEINYFLGSDLGQGALSSFTTALKLAAGALAGFAVARAAAFAKDKGVAAINASREAMNSYKQATIASAEAQKRAAYAELSRYQAYLQTAQGQRQLMASEQQRQAMLAREIQLVNQVTAAEQRLIAAQNMSTATMAKGGLMGALKGIVGFMGGPWNLAITGAIAGLTYLATGEDSTAEATDRHTAAQNTYHNVIEKVIDANGALTRSLTDVEAAEARAAERQLLRDKIEEIRGYASQLSELENEFNSMWNAATEDDMLSDSLIWQNEAIEAAKKYFNEYRNGNLTLDETKVKLDQIRQSMAMGAEDSGIAKWIDKFIGGGELKEFETQLKNIQTALGKTGDKTKEYTVVNEDAAKAVETMAEAFDKVNIAEKNNVSTLEGALKWLEKRNAQTEEGKARSEELAKATDLMAMAMLNAAITTAEFNAAAANTALLGENITASMIATAQKANDIVVQLKSAQASIEKGMQDPNWGATGGGRKVGGGRKKSGGGGGKSTDPAEAAKKWDELNSKLAQLEGRSTGAAESLNKTLKEIEDTGKAAKKSASDIEALKQAFIQATDTKTIKELNKELLQLEGNTRAVQEIENQEKVDQFRAKLADIRGMSQEEKDILMGRYQVAVETKVQVDDLQSAVDFLKDLESLGGEFGLTLQKQNELIEYQASLYREKLPADMQPYIDQWERLKLLGNDTSFMAGLERGVRKFGADYADLATTVENFTTQMGSTIGNTLSDAFMKGKFAAEDFFSSIISMAAQAASNYFIGMIFQGIGGFFGGGSTFSAGQSATMSANGMQSGFGGWLTGVHGHAKGDVFSGGNIGVFSGRVVKGPTLFNFDRQITFFARGAGVMGEAGAEAILPLARMSNGDLGVQYKIDDTGRSWQSETAGYARIIAELQSQMRSDRQYDNQAPKISINISNQVPNADVQAGQMQPDGNGGFNMEIVVSQIEQRIVGRMKQGKSQIAQYQESAYGMSRAGVIARGRGRN